MRKQIILMQFQVRSFYTVRSISLVWIVFVDRCAIPTFFKIKFDYPGHKVFDLFKFFVSERAVIIPDDRAQRGTVAADHHIFSRILFQYRF